VHRRDRVHGTRHCIYSGHRSQYEYSVRDSQNRRERNLCSSPAALDVATGQEKFNGPVKLKATFRTNTGSVATFKDLYQMNRPGLLLVNGTIYAASVRTDAITVIRAGCWHTTRSHSSRSGRSTLHRSKVCRPSGRVGLG